MALSEQCLEQLGLHAPPFEDAPDETFIYSDPLLDGLLESARAALNGPGAVVLMTGENGSGRSLQLMRLLAMLPEPFELIAFRARINTQFESVDNTIRSYLRSQNADDPDRALTELLGNRVADGADPVIAMDDAHLVGTDIVNNLMRMRSEILARHGRAPRIILVGSNGLLRRRLYLPDPSDEDQVTRVGLRAFNLEQTAAYLRHRLQAAGLADPERLLDADSVHHLQTTSQGLPGNLNREANSLLERQCRSERRNTVAAATAGAGVATGAAAEAADTPRDAPTPQEPLEPTFSATRDEAVSDAPEPDVALAATRDTSRSDFTPAAEALATGDQRPAPPEPPEGFEGIEADTRIPQPPATESTAFWNQRWFVPAVALTVAVGIAAPVAWQLLETESVPADSEIIELPLPEPRITEAEPAVEPEPATDDTLALGDPLDLPAPTESAPEPTTAPTEAPSAPARDPEPAPEPEPDPPAQPADPEPAPEPEPEPEPESTPEPEPEPEPATTAADEADAERLSNDRAWLNNQDSGATTIQLLAAPNLSTARAYADRHELGGIRYIPTRVNGRDFVVILAGAFADREAAQRAVEDLPAAVRNDGPWVRSIGSVQNVVRD
ncbi:SPOR domain-containing protein [Thioalkalivibrio sp. ALJ16]|uniref:SPOR domain-containing protein n=1 Tax=Thioalkalivibrio sp. ALJ16 TaxID=1158762 RepID=UPI00036C8143|nr:SPOR domain-containing protein [Thioalkalivibrio sp. ALJ16]